MSMIYVHDSDIDAMKTTGPSSMYGEVYFKQKLQQTIEYLMTLSAD